MYTTLSFLIQRGTSNKKHCPKFLEYWPITCCTTISNVLNITFVSLMLHYSKIKPLQLILPNYRKVLCFDRNDWRKDRLISMIPENNDFTLMVRLWIISVILKSIFEFRTWITNVQVPSQTSCWMKDLDETNTVEVK